MQSWNLRTVGVEPHEPEILSSGKDARMILLHLPAGEELQEHEVHERARVIVIEGEVDTSMPSGDSVREDRVTFSSSSRASAIPSRRDPTPACY